MLTQKHAKIIASKLACQVYEGRKHTIAEFHEGGRLIASFGIRRGSREEPHSYIPKQLHVTAKQCREIHECSRTREDYVRILREKSLL